MRTTIKIFILFSVLFAISCNNQKTEKKISLVSFISSHPIFNTIETSFKDELKKQLGNDVKYRIIESNAQGNMEALPTIASQVLNLKPDIIVPISTPCTQAIMRQADDKIKIVYTFVSDTLNLKDALQRTNSTGFSDVINYKGNIELIQSIYSDSVKIGIMYNPNEANSIKGKTEIDNLIKAYPNTKVIYSTVTSENEINLVSKSLLKNVDVILSIGDNTVATGLQSVINSATEMNKAVFAIDEGTIKELGGVGGISVDYEKLGRETAVLVADILKNDEEPSNIKKILLYGNKLILNKKAIDKLGLNVSDSIYSKAQIVE